MGSHLPAFAHSRTKIGWSRKSRRRIFDLSPFESCDGRWWWEELAPCAQKQTDRRRYAPCYDDGVPTIQANWQSWEGECCDALPPFGQRVVDLASSGRSVWGEEKKGRWSRALPTISSSICPPYLWFTWQQFFEAAKTSPLWPTRSAPSIQGTEARRRAWVHSILLDACGLFFLREINNAFSRNIWRIYSGRTSWHALFAAMGYCHQAWACISEAGFRPCFDGRKVVELPVQFSNWASAAICTRIPSPYSTRSTSCVHCALPWFKNLQQHYFAAVEPENMGSLIWFPDVGRLTGGTLSDRSLW